MLLRNRPVRSFRNRLARRPEAVFGNCTRETARCSDARDYMVELRECCRGHIRQIVVDTIEVLDRLGIVYWADYGTLLGAVRNPMLGLPAGIIPHDKDADFGFTGANFMALQPVKRELEAKGYSVALRHTMGSKDCRSLKVRLSKMNHSNADFFCWKEQRGMMIREKFIDVDRFKGRNFPTTMLYPLSTVEWEGLQLPGPVDPIAFCAFRYGPSWKVPIRANHDGVLRG